MNITVEHIDGVAVITSLPPHIDASNVMEFKAQIGTIIGEHNRVLFDMGAVKFIDSAGCGALITALRLIRNSGETLKICSAQSQVRTVFELVRMHKLMEIYNTRQEALMSYERPKE
jgi:anti-sigma B factor antagonist